MTHADTNAADPAQTIIAIEAALARLEQAEAGTAEAPFVVKARYVSYGETGDGETYFDLCPDDCGYIAFFEVEADATGIATMRNDAPGSLRFRREMLAMCREWLDNPVLDTAPFGPEWCAASGKKAAALRIIAALAASLGVK